eukprot:scaffold95161_cov39-Phaeocystis_antarctica.AAC.2
MFLDWRPPLEASCRRPRDEDHTAFDEDVFASPARRPADGMSGHLARRAAFGWSRTGSKHLRQHQAT